MDRVNASADPRARGRELQAAGADAVSELLRLGGDEIARLIVRIQMGTLGPERIRQEADHLERGDKEAA